MVRWFRRGAPSAAPPRSTGPPPGGVPPTPPAPGGSGGSGFGGVGGPGQDGSGGDGPGPGGSGAGGSGAGPRAPRLGLGAPQTPEERRFTQVYAADRVGPVPYPNQAAPDVAAARGRVRALVNDLLPGGVDEGTGAALDPLIASWTSGWLARIDSEHADHHAVVDRLVGGARQQLADAEAAHERDRRALEVARRDYDDARARLLEPVSPPDAATGAGPAIGAHSAGADPAAAEPSGPAAGTPTDPPTGPVPTYRPPGHAPGHHSPGHHAPGHAPGPVDR